MTKFIVSLFILAVTFFFAPVAFACEPEEVGDIGCVPIVEQAGELSRIFEMQDMLADHEDQLATYRRQLASQQTLLEEEAIRSQETQRQLAALEAELERIDGLEAELESARDMIATNTASVEAVMVLVRDTISPRLYALGERVDALEEEMDIVLDRLTDVELELDRFNFTLVGTGGYVQAGSLSGGLLGAGIGVELALADAGNLGLQINLLPAGTFLGNGGAQLATTGGFNFLAGGERIRALLGYSAGWIPYVTNGSAGQWHHGNLGVEFLVGSSKRWSLFPVFHAGWGASSVANRIVEGPSFGASLTALIRF